MNMSAGNNLFALVQTLLIQKVFKKFHLHAGIKYISKVCEVLNYSLDKRELIVTQNISKDKVLVKHEQRILYTIIFFY